MREGTPGQQSWPAAGDISVRALQHWPQTRPLLALWGRLGHTAAACSASEQRRVRPLSLCVTVSLPPFFLMTQKAELPAPRSKMIHLFYCYLLKQ